MARYYQKIDGSLVDVETLCEPANYNGNAEGFGNVATSSFTPKFKGAGPFQKAGTNTTNITLSDYKVDGTPISVVKKGHYPLFPSALYDFEEGYCLWHSRAGGTEFTLTRESNKLTIGDVTLTSFRSGVVPSEIIIFAVGAGGGGGGKGYSYDGKDLVQVPGGGGGGGGMVIGRVNIEENPVLKLYVGKAGQCGTDGNSDDESRGSQGYPYYTNTEDTFNHGCNTEVRTGDGTLILRAYAGEGGMGASIMDSEAGISEFAGRSGSGGKGYVNPDYFPRIDDTNYIPYAIAQGGKGSSAKTVSLRNTDMYANNQTDPTIAQTLKFLPAEGTGADEVEVSVSTAYPWDAFGGIKSNNKADHEHNFAAANSYFYSGGCSLYPGTYKTSADSSVTYTSSIGGGGQAGSRAGNGAPGLILICY